MPEYDPLGNPKRNDDEITVSIDGVEVGTASNIIIKEPLDVINFEIRKTKLECVSNELAEEFEYLWNHSRYDSDTLYKVFLSHGGDAKKIIESAIKNNLPAWKLLFTSDRLLDIKSSEGLNKLTKFISDDARLIDKEKKLPKKYRNGWS